MSRLHPTGSASGSVKVLLPTVVEPLPPTSSNLKSEPN